MGASISLWTLFIGGSWLAHDLGGNSAVGLVAFVSFAPYLLSPLGGALADRFDRRRVVLAARTVGLVLVAALAALAFADVLTVPLLVASVFLITFARAMEQPAESALVPNTVPPAELLNAITLSTAAYLGSEVFVPLAAAALQETAGAGAVFALSAIASACAIASVARVRVRSTGDVMKMGSVAVDTLRSVGYVRRTGPVLMVFGVVALHCSLTMSYGALMPEFAKHVMDGGDREFNALNLAIGAGALFGTLAVSTASRPGMRGTMFLATGLGSGLFPVFLAISGSIGWGAAAAIGIGASQSVFMALASTLLQSVVPDGMRGRVMSLYTMLAAGVMAIANLTNGLLANPLGTPILFAAPGLTFAAILVVWSLMRADLRRVYRTGVLSPVRTHA